MLQYRVALVSVVLGAGIAQVRGQKDAQVSVGGEQPGKVVQELKIEAPAMTEEDQYGYVMPDRYRCQACRAVMFHLDAELRKRQPKGRRLKQWEYTDVMDDTCRSGFQGYGVKLVDGENALSGPAFVGDESKIQPGSGSVQMSSDSWNKRLGEICRKVVYEELGEEELYEKFYEGYKSDGEEDGPALGKELCKAELTYCRETKKPKQPAAKKEAKKPKEKKAKAKPKKETAVAQAAEASSEERVSPEDMLRKLAVAHGYSSSEYVGTRTEREWKKLFLSISGRIHNQMADDATSSCKAGGR